MFQDLPSRIERTEGSRSAKRRRRFHPGMIEELMFSPKNPLLGIRVGLSMLRDPLPWVYDEGVALIAKIQALKSMPARKRALDEFEELIMFSTRHPYIEKFLVDSEDDFLLMREVPQMLLHAMSRWALSGQADA